MKASPTESIFTPPRSMPVARYMTPLPICVEADATPEEAARLMKEHHIRHLPVKQGGKLVGVLSARELELARTPSSFPPKHLMMSPALERHVLTVHARDDLREVAATMAERRVGSAVVVDGERVVGIFTTVDALSALADLLGRRSWR